MSLVSRCLKRFHDNRSNFTIDHILNVAGESGKKCTSRSFESKEQEKHFEWLNCTRYRPPKLPRQRKKEGIQRRNLGRNPRIPFSNSQVAFLEAKFLRTPYLSSNDVTQLATYLKLTETRVKIWFQNRRAREKRNNERKNQVKEMAKDQRGPNTILQNVFPSPEILLNPQKAFLLHPTKSLKCLNCKKSEYSQISPLNLTEK